jgi:predicted Rossmann-fold nucleotide-binding protein
MVANKKKKTAHINFDVRGASSEGLDVLIEDFKKESSIRFVLAFSGGGEEANKEYLSNIMRETMAPLRGYPIAILSGGTNWGVPSAALEIAKEFGFATIGVFPLVAREKGYVLIDSIIDLGLCVFPTIGKSEWGDESSLFTKLLDATIIIGGGAGTMIEVAHLLKQNERKNVLQKHLIPIHGSGGTADRISLLSGKPEILARCMPSYPITSGREACRYLKEVIFIDEITIN